MTAVPNDFDSDCGPLDDRTDSEAQQGSLIRLLREANGFRLIFAVATLRPSATT